MCGDGEGGTGEDGELHTGDIGNRHCFVFIFFSSREKSMLSPIPPTLHEIKISIVHGDKDFSGV